MHSPPASIISLSLFHSHISSQWTFLLFPLWQASTWAPSVKTIQAVRARLLNDALFFFWPLNREIYTRNMSSKRMLIVFRALQGGEMYQEPIHKIRLYPASKCLPTNWCFLCAHCFFGNFCYPCMICEGKGSR